MLEVARIMAGVSLVSVILAIAAAISPLGRLQLARLNHGSRADDRYLRMVAYLLMIAVGVGGMAALLAVSGWFY
jgi:hypothetical protein